MYRKQHISSIKNRKSRMFFSKKHDPGLRDTVGDGFGVGH
jgi:hypothetical protein